MTREEAITTLAKIQKLLAIYPKRKKQRESVNEIDTAIGMAIEALQREEAEEKGYCHRIRPSNVEVVVRCKDCKFKSLYDDGDTKYYYCALEDRPNRNWSVDDTDYCSWGERKGGGDE